MIAPVRYNVAIDTWNEVIFLITTTEIHLIKAENHKIHTQVYTYIAA